MRNVIHEYGNQLIVTKVDAIDLKCWLVENKYLNTAKKLLVQLNACYKWALKQRLILNNHCLDAGMNPVVVAQITGCDIQIIYEKYAGSLLNRPVIPEII